MFIPPRFSGILLETTIANSRSVQTLSDPVIHRCGISDSAGTNKTPGYVNGTSHPSWGMYMARHETDEARKKDNEIRKIRALHIEDDQIIRHLVKAYLKNYIDVDEAENGDEALLRSKNHLYDLIISDINLGDGMDGIEACREIKTMSRYRHVPIIAATANSQSTVRNQCFEIGMNAFLIKPFMKEELIQTIQKVLKTA